MDANRPRFVFPSVFLFCLNNWSYEQLNIVKLILDSDWRADNENWVFTFILFKNTFYLYITDILTAFIHSLRESGPNLQPQL